MAPSRRHIRGPERHPWKAWENGLTRARWGEGVAGGQRSGIVGAPIGCAPGLLFLVGDEAVA